MPFQRTRVLRHHYNPATAKWAKVQGEIHIEDVPFAEGAFRSAYRALMQWEGAPNVSFVCKIAKDPATPRQTYFADVEAHEIASLYAHKFNETLERRIACTQSNTSAASVAAAAAAATAAAADGAPSAPSPPPFQPLQYVPAFVVEFVDRPGRPVYGCERLLQGRFRKYNNNVGAVCGPGGEESSAATASAAASAACGTFDPVSTAVAFSHFSYEASNHLGLVCDLQGVDNLLTDPQIHTLNGKGFGLGNLGQTGIRAFLLRHACNHVCRTLQLPRIEPKAMSEKKVDNQTINLAAMVLNYCGAPSLLSVPAKRAAMQHSRSSGAIDTDGDDSNRAGARSADVLTLEDSSAASQPAHGLPASNSAHQLSAQRQARRSPQPGQQHPSAFRPVASDVGRPPPHGGGSSQHAQHGSARASPSPSSPSDSPRSRSSRSVSASPVPRPTPSPLPAAAAEKSGVKSRSTLDDSDEALMASILGE